MIKEISKTSMRKQNNRLPFGYTANRRICREDLTRKKRPIVVPMDFTSACADGLDYAMSYARKLNCRVQIVHVLERSYAEEFLEKHQREQLRERARSSVTDKLKHLAAFKSNADVPISFEVRSGLPEYEILKAAEAANAELIIIPRKNRGVLSRMIFGSVTENVLEASPIPVLVITYSDSGGRAASLRP